MMNDRSLVMAFSPGRSRVREMTPSSAV